MSVQVAWSRFEEARKITDALADRLRRERRGLRAGYAEDRLLMLRRMDATRIELVDTLAYEARVFQQWEHERSAASGRPVKGSRSVRNRQEAHVEGQPSSRRPQRPVQRVASTSGKGDQ